MVTQTQRIEAKTPAAATLEIAQQLELLASIGERGGFARLVDEEQSTRIRIAALTPSDRDFEAAASPPPAEWFDEDWSR